MKLAVIPARGASRRIPKKNIRDFCGKPIIAYSIERALESKLFDRVIVSTDDEEIATVARKFGAEIPFPRPKELSDSHTGTNAVVKHAIQWYHQQNQYVEFACCIYATAPFLLVKYLKEGYSKLVDSNKSFVFSVTTFSSPVQRAIRITEQGVIEAFCPDYIDSRSQDLEQLYHDAAQFYWGRPEAFLKGVVTFSAASSAVVLPRHIVQDIDTLEDWRCAELMYQALN